MLRRTGALLPALLVVACAATTACDKSPATKSAGAEAKAPAGPSASAAPGASDPGADSSPILALGPAKIMREGHGDRAIVLAPDGQVTMAGKPFATLSSTGELRDPQGVLMMTVQGDGSVVGDAGPTGVQVSASGGRYKSDNLELELSFGPDGKIETKASGAYAGLLGTDSPALVSEGCTGTMTQTCALVTLNYLMALGNPDSPRNE